MTARLLALVLGLGLIFLSGDEDRAAVVLGTGTGALIGGDLTDPENNGDPQNNVNYNAVFAADQEASFGAGEAAFNVFDNRVGGGDDKWCCGNTPGGFPHWVQATFPVPYRLTRFTITSSNDTPGRDPRVWQVLGSNDGVNFTPIFTQNNPGASVWTPFGDVRDQVIRFDAGVDFANPASYTTFRLNTDATGLVGGADFAISEIEFFGVANDGTLRSIANGAWDNPGTWTGAPPPVPTNFTDTIVENNCNVTVANPGALAGTVALTSGRLDVNSTLAVTSGVTATGGTLGVGPSGVLTVGGNLNVTSPAVLAMAGGGRVVANGGGTVQSATTSGNSTFDGTGNLKVAGLSDQGLPGTLAKTGTGSLTLDNSAGPIVLGATTLRVDQGVLALAGTSPFGGPSAVTLNGGTLSIEAGTFQNGLRASIFRNTPGTDVPLNLGGSGYQVSGTRIFTGDKPGTVLAMTEDPAMNAVATGQISGFGMFPGFASTDNFVSAFSGRFVPAATGNYTFRWSNDDRGWMWLDANRNGAFDTGEAVGSYAWDSTASVALTAGQRYNFVYMTQEFGGGESNNFWYTPPGGGEVYVNPTAQAGQWQYFIPSGTVSMTGTPISVTANSRLEVTSTGTAALGTLTLAGGTTLTAAGSPMSFVSTSFGAGSELVASAGAVGLGNVSVPVSATISGTAPVTAGTASLGTGAQWNFAGSNAMTINAMTTNGGSTWNVGASAFVAAAVLNDQNIPGTLTKIGAGTLALDNGTGTSDAGDTTFRAEAGTLRLTGANPFAGSTSAILDGGTLVVQGAAPTLSNQVRYGHFAAQTGVPGAAYLTGIDDGLANGRNGGLFNAVPNPSGTWTGVLDAASRGDNYSFMFNGYFRAPETGNYTFWFNHDDDATVWLDRNQNGDFEFSAVPSLNERLISAPCCGEQSATVALTAGQFYAFAFAYTEGGGGDYGQTDIQTPSLGRRNADTNDPAQANMWYAGGIGPVSATTTGLNVLRNSTLRAVSDAPPALFGALTIQNGATLTTEGAAMSFTGLSLVGPAGRTVGMTTSNSATAPMFNDGGVATTFVKGGAGALFLDNTGGVGSATATAFRIDGGTLRALGANSLAGATSAQLNGGTLELKGDVTVLATNALQHRGYHAVPDASLFNIHRNNGLWLVNPYGSPLFTAGPGNRGLDFGSDADFTLNGAVAYGDNYSNLFTGYLNVTPATAGAYTFRVSRDDDWSAVWLDLNQDGVFQSNTGTLATNNGELLAWEDGGTKTVNLAPGKYRFAVGHAEGGGGSTITVYVKSPAMAAEAIIKPADAAQAGLWSVENVGAINQPGLNISVTANSGLRMVTDQTATLGALTMNAGTTLSTSGGNTVFQGGLTVSGGAAGRTVTLAADGSRLTIQGYTDGGIPTTLVKTALGTLALQNVSTVSGSAFQVNAGTLATSGPSPIGNAQSIVLGGGTFEVTGATTPVANALSHRGYDLAPDSAMNLHNNLGLMALPISGRTLVNRNVVSLFSDTDFLSTGVVTRWDNFMNLWVGYLNVTTTGNYQFKIDGDTDRSMIWLDLNRDGIFASNTGQLATNNGELLAWEDTGTKTVNLATPGQYLFAVGHGSYGGSVLNRAQVAAPGGSLMLISPGNPNQAGYWSTDAAAAVNLGTTDVAVTAGTSGSVLRALTDYDATFRNLSLGANSSLTLSGAKMNFASTAFGAGSTLNAATAGAHLGTVTTSGGQSNIGSVSNAVLDGAAVNPIVTAGSYSDQGIANSTMRLFNGGTLVLDNSTPGTVVAGNTTFRVEANSLLRAAPTAPATPVLGAGSPRVTLAGGTLSLEGAPDGSTVSNALSHIGYHGTPERILNLDGATGIPNRVGSLARVPYNRVRFTDGAAFGGRGLYPQNDAEFIASGAVNQGDNYTNVWLGYLNVTTPGNYEFRIGGQDDRGGIWLDLDRDGVFRSTSGGLETNNGELIAWQDNATKTVSLGVGQYRVAVVQGEFGGGSNVQAYIRSPTMAAQTFIKPADAAQAGLWSFAALGDINAGNTNVSAVAGSNIISALTDRTASLGRLSIGPVASLTTSGGPGTIKFLDTTLATTPSAIAYVVPAAQVGNQAYTGPLGMDFNVTTDVWLTQFGVFDSGSDGLSAPINVRIYDRNNTAFPIATLDFTPGDPGTLIGGSRFKTLATPLRLPAGFVGSIVADGFNAVDLNGNNISPLPWTTNTGGGALSFVGSGRYGTVVGSYPGTGDGGPANRYAAGTFQFEGAVDVTFNVLTTTYPGPLTGSGAAPARVISQGISDLVLDQPGTGLGNTTIEHRGGGGRLVVNGPATVAGATLGLGAPVPNAAGVIASGHLHLTSPDGTAQTYANPIRATAGGTLMAGQATVFAGGAPTTVGSPTGSIILPNLKPTEGAVVQLRDQVQNGYILLPNGVNSPGYVLANALAHYGYHIFNDPLAADLSASNFAYAGMMVGGMWSGGKPASFQTFYGKEVLTSGPGGRGLDYNNDGDFLAGGAIGQSDNYSDLFIGKLTVTPAMAGNWNFRINVQDDPTGMWIDLNRNGMFDSSVPGLTSDRGEQLLWNAAATRTVNLAAGEYLIAFTHREGGGGSQIEAQFQAPGMGALTMIKPSDPAQAGLWSMPVQGGGLDIAQGEVRTLKALSLGTLILQPTGWLNRYTDHALDRNITVTERLVVGTSLAMTLGEQLTTTGADVTINPGATLFIDHPVNAGSLNVQGNLARVGAGADADVTVTRSLTLNSAMSFAAGGNLTATGANLNVSPGGTLVTSAPIVAKSLASSGAVTTPGATVSDLVIAGGTTTLTGNAVVTGSLRGGGGALATQGNITLDVSGAGLVNVNSQIRVDSGSLTINAPAGGGLPAGLQAYYSAGAAAVTGSGVTRLYDLSGYGRDMANVLGNPTYVADSANGLPAVRFYATDGTDAMWTDYNFDPATEYTVITVDRLTGGANARVITSRTRNWLFSHHGGGDARWHADGWITPQGGNANTLWDVNAGTITSAADPVANFWYNGAQTATNSTGSGNGTHMIGQFQVGAYFSNNTYSEASNAEVADILIFNRVLTAAERNAVASYLAARYGVANTYSATPFSSPAVLGGLRLAPSTQASVAGSGTAVFNSLGLTGGLVATGPMTVSGAPSFSSNAAGDTLTVNATLAAAKFNLTGSGTVALAQNLTVAPGGSLSVAGSANIRSLNTLTIDAASAAVNINGGLHVAAGTLTFRTPVPTALPAGPIGYWPFNEGTGTTTADASGGGNAGTINANAAWVNDPARGYVLNFPASGSVTVPAAAVASLAGGSQVTISLWQYGDVAQQPRNDYVFEARNAAGQRVLSSHLPWGDSQVYWDAGNVTTSYDRINRAAQPGEFEGAWHNWTYVKNATTGTLAIYLDGQLWHSGTGLTRTMEPITSFRIGSNGGGTESYAGLIDEFAMWNRALSVAEIQAIYNAGLAGGYGPAHLGNLTLASGTGLVLADSFGTPGAGQARFDSITTAGAASIQGGVTLSGDLRPGAGPGTLTINGNFTTGPGTTYHWETNGAQSDLVAVSGSLSINGGTLKPYLAGVVPNGRYNLLTYGGSLNVGALPNVVPGNSYAELIDPAASSVGADATSVFINIVKVPTVQWNSSGTTAWNVASHWTPNTVPNATTAAVVNTSGQVATVTGAMGTQAAKTLIVDGGHARVDLGGTLQVAENAWVEPTGQLTVNGSLKVGSVIGAPPALLNGLMGYWDLDETSGTTAADSSGRGHAGTVNGSAQWQPAGGRFGGAMRFDGATDIRIPYSADFNLSTFTVSGWVNIAQEQSNGGILGTRFGGENTFDLKVRGSDIHGDIGTGSAWINTGVDITAAQGGDIPLNSWQMVTYVIDDAAKQFQLYLNGTLRNTISYSGTPALMVAGREMRLGNASGTEFLANGLLDDVAVWGRALSAADVLAVYNTGLASTRVGGTLTTAGTTTFGPGATLDIPVIHVIGGTTTGNGTALGADTTLRLSGGTLAGSFTAANPSTTAGKYAYEVESGTSNASLGGTQASLRKSTAGAAVLNGPVNLNRMDIVEGSLTMNSGSVNALSIASGSAMNLTGNINVAQELKGAGTLNVVVNNTSLINASTALVGFGGSLNVVNGNPANPTNSLLITVPAGGSTIAGITGGLLGHWPFDSVAGGVTPDASGGGHPGAVTNATLITGQAGNALSFNGASAFVTSGAPLMNGLTAFTMSGWVKPTAGGGRVGLYGQNDKVEAGIDGTTNFAIWANGTGQLNSAMPFSMPAAGWHHVVYVGDASGLRIWVDGTQIGTMGGGPNNATSGYNFNIGGGGIWDAAGNWFNGGIDDVALWDRALTPAEIASVYQAGSSGGIPSLGNLRLDPGTQLTVGGAARASFTSIGVTGGPTVTGGLTLSGAANLRGSAAGLAVNGTLDASNFETSGPGAVTLLDQSRLNVAAGGTLKVPAGSTLASQGNALLDVAQAGVQFKGTLQVAAGTLTLNAPAPVAAPTGATAYWGFDETGGAVALDSSGNGRNGTLINNPGRVAGGGMIGSALQFNDANTYVAVSRATNGGINIDNQSFSLSIWSKLAPGTAGSDYFFGQGTSNTTDNVLHAGRRDATNQTLAFYADDLNYGNSAVVSDTANWHHWVMTYDSATRAQTIWVDGRSVATRTAGGNFSAGGSTDFWIGQANNGNWFGGLLDEAAVYNRVLNTADIQSLYRAGLQGGYGPARFGNLDMAPATTLDVGGSGAVGFTTINTGHGALVRGDVTVDQRIDLGGLLSVDGDFTMSDGVAYDWGLKLGPRDLVDVSGDLNIEGSFTFRVFGEGGYQIWPTEQVPLVLFDGQLIEEGSVWGPGSALDYTIEIGNPANPDALYLWDISQAGIEYLPLGPAGQGLYLTGFQGIKIPEPSTVVLGALALIGLGAYCWRRRRRR